MEWYPSDSEKLKQDLEKYISKKPEKFSEKEIHGLVVPHAGYEFSGEIAGKAYSLIKDKGFEKAIILAPSHYAMFQGITSVEKIETPLGKPEILENPYTKGSYEHAIDNQVPFLQYLGINKILPLVIGEISVTESEKIAKEILKQKDEKTIIIISTDLSHFLSYEEANQVDKETIKIIQNLKTSQSEAIDACGKMPLMILIEMAKIQDWKPELIEHKTSADTKPELGKEKVVGYMSMIF